MELNFAPSGARKMNSFGQYLKTQREKRGISLEELSERSKINYKILRLLENDQYTLLPKVAYIRGFSQNYARLLQIPVDEVLEEFKKYQHFYQGPEGSSHTFREEMEETKENTDEIQKSISPSLGDKALEAFFSKKTLTPLILFGLLGFSSYKVILHLKFKMEDVPQEQSGNQEIIPITDITEQSPIKPAEANILEMEKSQDLRQLATGEVGVLPVPGPKPIEVIATEPPAPEKPTEEAAPTPPPSNSAFPLVEFKPIPEETFSMVDGSPLASDDLIFPSGYRALSKAGQQNLFVHATEGETWLSYKVDDKPIKSFVLKSGKYLFVQGELIRIFLGNVNVTKIFYNNQLITTPTPTGVKSMVFPKEKGKEFSLPLFVMDKNGIMRTSEEYKTYMQAP